MNKIALVFLLCVVLPTSQLAMSVVDVKINSQVFPVAVESTPHVSWVIEDDIRGCLQTAYRITIFKDKDNGSIAYDTGEVFSSTSTDVHLNDFGMAPLTKYFLTVSIKDNHGCTAVSKPLLFETGLVGTGWGNAQWITHPFVESESSVIEFRKSFMVKPGVAVKSAFLCTTALGIYDIYCNGRRVGHFMNGMNSEDSVIYEELKPGWTEYRRRVNYSSHEISRYLEKENTIGIIIADGWWRGRVSANLYGNVALGILAKLVISYEDGTQEEVLTDGQWKSRQSTVLKESDIYDGEHYDYSCYDGWLMPDYNDDSWTKIILHPGYDGKIVSNTSFPIGIKNLALNPETITVYDGLVNNGTDYGIINKKAIYNSLPFKIRKGEVAVIDFGQNLVGWTPFKLKGKKGTSIKLRYAEMLNDTGEKNRGNDGPGGSVYTENLRSAKATLKYDLRGEDGKEESYCTFSTYFGFRYCEIEADNDVIIEEIKALPVSSAIEETGNVITNNEKLNKLYQNIKWGQRGNFISIPTDCPQRDERWGWTGDTQVFCRTGMYNFFTEDFYHNYSQALIDSQDESGAYPDIAPYKPCKYGNAGWGDAGVIIPWTIYKMFGNKDVLYENFDAMERYLGWLSTLERDNVKYSGAGIDYGDWLAFDKCDNRYVSMAYYAHVAKIMSEICYELCQTSDDEYSLKGLEYIELYNNIKSKFQELFWSNGPVEKSQGALLIALAFDLLNDEQINDALELLSSAIIRNEGLLSTGFLCTAIFLPTLSKYNLHNDAYNLLLQTDNPSWLYSVDQGATTIWERWDSYTKDNGFGPATMNSFNHYAYGAVGEWLYRFMGGIDNDRKIGFSDFTLRPIFDTRKIIPPGQNRINSVLVTFNSKYGHIKSRWILATENDFDYECTVPANTTATLVLPNDLIEGRKLYENGVEYDYKLDDNIEEGGYKGNITLKLNSGSYHFHNYETTDIKSILLQDNPLIGNISSTDLKCGHIKRIDVFDINGRIIKTYDSPNIENILCLKTSAIYMIKITYTNNKNVTYKIIGRY